MEAWAQLTLHGIHSGGSANVLFTVMSQPRSYTSDAVWWVPKNGSSVIALGNSSGKPVHSNLIFSNGEARTIDIAPFATEIIRRHPFAGPGPLSHSDSASIIYTGPAGSLIPTGITSSDDGKFASMIRFYDTQHTVQQSLFANNLRIKDSVPHMVLRNASSDFITVNPSFLTTAGEEALKIPEVRLAPQEVSELDLRPLLKLAAKRSDLDSVSVKVLNTGQRGSLIGALYSVNARTGVVYDVPLRDSGPVRASTGAYPVRLDRDYTTSAIRQLNQATLQCNLTTTEGTSSLESSISAKAPLKHLTFGKCVMSRRLT